MRKSHAIIRWPVEREIRRKLGDDEETTEGILASSEFAMRLLLNGTIEQSYCSMLALVLLHRDTSDAFRELTNGIARDPGANSQLRSLAAISIGNNFAATSNESSLATLRAIIAEVGVEQIVAESATLAVARIARTSTDGNSLRTIQDSLRRNPCGCPELEDGLAELIKLLGENFPYCQ